MPLEQRVLDQRPADSGPAVGRQNEVPRVGDMRSAADEVGPDVVAADQVGPERATHTADDPTTQVPSKSARVSGATCGNPSLVATIRAKPP